MLHRDDPDGLIVLTQPAHAWLSGQLARAWGNGRFGAVAPWEEVCLAAEQHDLGWLDWEAAPTLNPATGRPHRFLEMPLATHLGMWATAGPRALAFGRYVALLVSLHGAGLYERRDTSADSPDDIRAIQEFLAGQRAFQERLLTSLRADPRSAAAASPEQVWRNRELIRVWDNLSLLLCMGLRRERTVATVPTAGDAAPLTLAPRDGDPTRVAIAPWPFGDDAVTLVGEGRRLARTFEDEAAMRAALAEAPWVALEVRLVPA